MPLSEPQQPTFHKQRHIKYFLRCLKTLLPQAYTATDSSRMTLGFFILAGLDLLGALDTSTTAAERAGYANWIYHCQVPSTGGFRGFSGTHFGDQRRTEQNACWDPANVAATFFALATLLILGDDLARVRRRECLLWLKKMQRSDGSFGEVLGANGEIEGDRDLRFCCCAAGIRYILRGQDEAFLKDLEDIDVQRLAEYVRSCQAYDGGFAGAPANESHAGLTYCALGTLSFLGLIPTEPGNTGPPSTSPISRANDLVGWLASRQTNQLHDIDGDEEEEEEHSDAQNKPPPESAPTNSSSLPLEELIASLPALPETSQLPHDIVSCAGFNGRLNKTADTCYSFWVSGSLAILDKISVVNAVANRNFLLEKTQHMIGGFGKCVDEPPDVLHSYLGLASLGLLGEQDLDEVDPTFCTSKRARQHLESLPWWRAKETI
ncbi:hypothetical protein VTO42DRAFT_3916 [Malbranchea cinnamomea]